ncbi:hypothetical protein [Mycoplasma suis]|uniref:hypothetical protein n=1 Tax=Mycoplasma suis TaxID=57372 RepID=UPI0003165AD5|nr:hypothetical protein [Mycoplasma suis]
MNFSAGFSGVCFLDSLEIEEFLGFDVTGGWEREELLSGFLTGDLFSEVWEFATEITGEVVIEDSGNCCVEGFDWKLLAWCSTLGSSLFSGNACLELAETIVDSCLFGCTPLVSWILLIGDWEFPVGLEILGWGCFTAIAEAEVCEDLDKLFVLPITGALGDVTPFEIFFEDAISLEGVDWDWVFLGTWRILGVGLSSLELIAGLDAWIGSLFSGIKVFTPLELA